MLIVCRRWCLFSWWCLFSKFHFSDCAFFRGWCLFSSGLIIARVRYILLLLISGSTRGQTGTGRSRNSGNVDQSLLGCLRSVPLYQLMRAARPLHRGGSGPFSGPNSASDGLDTSASPIRSTWGPSFDGVVVHSFKRRMRDYLDRMAR